jgi:hypothetical protein
MGGADGGMANLKPEVRKNGGLAHCLRRPEGWRLTGDFGPESGASKAGVSCAEPSERARLDGADKISAVRFGDALDENDTGNFGD